LFFLGEKTNVFISNENEVSRHPKNRPGRGRYVSKFLREIITKIPTRPHMFLRRKNNGTKFEHGSVSPPYPLYFSKGDGRGEAAKGHFSVVSGNK
jgi:hypothetical protein